MTQILAGCGTKEVNTPQDKTESKSVENNSQDSSKQDSSKSDDDSDDKSSGESLYPIANGDITLKVWMPINPIATKYIQTYAENEAFKRAMEDTGVNLEFIHPANGQETEHFNLMIASQDYPDIAFDERYKGGVVQGVTDGIYEDLTELVPQYAPDYYALIQNNDEFRREVTTQDGRIYAFYIYKDVDAKFEGEWRRTQFRKDWLEEFGMDIPKTFDDYEAYFQKVLETKPGVAPFLLEPSGVEKQLLAPFDMSTGYYLKNGKVTWYGADPDYKEYLTLLNKWYEAGYISKDFTAGNAQDRFLAGEAACFIGTSINVFQAAKQLGIKVTTGPYVRKYEGQKLHASYTLFPKNTDSYKGVVFTTSKYKEESVAFINYGYSEEGWKTYQYGPKGIAWTEGPDGQPVYTDYVLNNPKYSITDVDFIIRTHSTHARLRDSDRLSIPSNIKDPETLEYRLMWADDPDADAEAILPPFTLPPEDNTRRAEIMGDIETYVSEMTLKFITGAEPLSNFDKYLETVKSMGVDEAIELTQKAYDAHMSK